MTLSKLDKKIISLVSRDMPLTEKPFRDIARLIGTDERTLLRRLKAFKRRGLMRKFSAALNHRKLGFRYNAMVVWSVPRKFVDKAGNIMASFDEVSHCYQRRTAPDWEYNLYSMVHGRTKNGCLDAVRKIRKALGRKVEHKALFSSKEEKKTGSKF